MRIWVIPQQHWDPFWKYDVRISEEIGAYNVLKVLNILKEEKDFRYSIDQVYLIEIFKRKFPQRYEELKRRIKEGKIELVNGGYTNPDLNLPSGESLIRNIAYCQKRWKEEFGIEAKVLSMQDSFGQSGQIPQICCKMNLKYATSKRGASKDLEGVFVWEGVDGSRIIFDRQPLGHHGIFLFPTFSAIPNRIKPNEKFERIIRKNFILSRIFAWIAFNLPDLAIWTATKGKFFRFKSALKFLIERYPLGEIFIPYGFGMDGGRPFAWVVTLSRFYNKFYSKGKDKMIIATPSQYFKVVEENKNFLKVIKGELNGPTEKIGEACGALPGTYSTRIDVKQRVRRLERFLYLTELLECLKFVKFKEAEDLIEFWKEKWLIDFHDSICGSLTDSNYLYLKKKNELALEKIEYLFNKNLNLLASKEGSIFNPLPYPRVDLVKIGNEEKLVQVENLGFNQVKEVELKKEPFYFNEKNSLLITPFYLVILKEKGLEIYSYQKSKIKKLTGEKFAKIRSQQENGDSYFWDLKGEEWAEIETVFLKEVTFNKATIEIRSNLRKNKIVELIHFYRHTPRVDFGIYVKNQEKNVRIQICLDFNLNIEEIEREIPAGFIKDGESTGQKTWKEVFGEKYAYYDNIKCVQNWLFLKIKSSKKGIGIFNDGLPEHEIVSNKVFVTLLRCIGKLGIEGKGLNKFTPKNSVPWRAGSPIPIPLAQLQGDFKFRLSFTLIERDEVAKACYEFLFPLIYTKGQQNEQISLFSLKDFTCLPLAIKVTDKKDGILIRLLETTSKNKKIKIDPKFEFKSAYLVNLIEEKIKDLDNLEIEFKPQEIGTIVLNPE
jgi:alpha-mannosidase